MIVILISDVKPNVFNFSIDECRRNDSEKFELFHECRGIYHHGNNKQLLFENKFLNKNILQIRLKTHNKIQNFVYFYIKLRLIK